MKTLSVVSDTQSLGSACVLFIGGYWMGGMDVVRMYLGEYQVWAPAGRVLYGSEPRRTGTMGSAL